MRYNWYPRIPLWIVSTRRFEISIRIFIVMKWFLIINFQTLFKILHCQSSLEDNGIKTMVNMRGCGFTSLEVEIWVFKIYSSGLDILLYFTLKL